MSAFLTPSDEIRAAEWLTHAFRGDLDKARELETEGPISAMAVFKVLGLIWPEIILHPDDVFLAERADAALVFLLENGDGDG